MAKDKEIVQKETPTPEGISDRPEVSPLVDIYENEEEVLLVADFPGVDKDNIDIHFEKNELSISGKAFSGIQDNWNQTMREFVPADFHRSFRLARGIDVEKISAEYNNGVLKLHLPKSEALKPRQIEIQSASSTSQPVLESEKVN
jgi:HSP20 family molecular chaperone IbpA